MRSRSTTALERRPARSVEAKKRGVAVIDGIAEFSFPTAITFGPGSLGQLPRSLEDLGVGKPLLVTDGGLLDTDVFGAARRVLDESGVPVAIFGEVRPNPPVEDVEKAAEVYRAAGCDSVVGVGGGSALDAAKAVPVQVVNEGPLTRYNVQTGGNDLIRGPLPPMIAVPTTAGTGSEVGRCSVITAPSLGRKFLVCHPLMMPGRAILDPELTVGLPPLLTAGTGMDAFTHNIESLTAPIFHPMCDAIALKGIELVIRYLERAVKRPDDIEARGYMMIAAMMGAVAFQKDLGAAHSMAHPLSTECNVPHGLANAVCLGPVMRFNREVSAAPYAEVARCFGINTAEMSNPDAAEGAINAVLDLNRRVGIPGSLAEVGVRAEQLPLLARKAFEDPCHQTNASPCSEQDLLALYREAFGSGA